VGDRVAYSEDDSGERVAEVGSTLGAFLLSVLWNKELGEGTR
jgi:hypothetical protein